MSILTVPTVSPVAPPATAPAEPEGELRFLIHHVSWEGYEAILVALDDGMPRLTYDDGTLELMTPLLPHEVPKKQLARLVEALTEELDIPVVSVGSTTFFRRGVKKGLEPDEGYYLGHFERLIGQRRGDLETLPPPDLVIEVELTSPLLDKLGIYAALGIPEVWRYKATGLAVLLLGADGQYAESPRSRAFPSLPMDGFVAHLRAWDPTGETAWIKAFRRWVREVVAPHPPG